MRPSVDSSGKFIGMSAEFGSFGAGFSGIGTSRYTANNGVTPRSYSSFLFNDNYSNTEAAAAARKQKRLADWFDATGGDPRTQAVADNTATTGQRLNVHS